MVNSQNDVVRRAEELYDQRLRTELEATHRDFFVSIEPDSGDYYLGRTLEEAIGHARRAYPERLTYTCRVGHSVTVEIGGVP